MDAKDLSQAEHEYFLDWRRKLALLREKDGITMTPNEKKLNFWRQLWRVVERRYKFLPIIFLILIFALL